MRERCSSWRSSRRSRPVTTKNDDATEARAWVAWATAVAGSKATVTYSGYLYDVRVADTRGTKFDAGSFQFTLGTTPLQVISGFDQGVTGMKVGGQRTLVIPASLGYGAKIVRAHV